MITKKLCYWVLRQPWDRRFQVLSKRQEYEESKYFTWSLRNNVATSKWPWDRRFQVLTKRQGYEESKYFTWSLRNNVATSKWPWDRRFQVLTKRQGYEESKYWCKIRYYILVFLQTLTLVKAPLAIHPWICGLQDQNSRSNFCLVLTKWVPIFP